MALLRRFGSSGDVAARRTELRAVPLAWPGFRSVYVTSSKGGPGKTTASALLATGLGEVRPELVGYDDVNPDGSTAFARLFAPGTPAPASLIDLVRHAEAISAVSDLAQFAVRTERLLAVTNSDADRLAREGVSPADYGAVVNVLARYVQLLVIDGGTSLVDSAAQASFATADQLVWVVEALPSQIAAAEGDLRYLWNDREPELVRRTVVCFMQTDPRYDVAGLFEAGAREFFDEHCAGVVAVPYDRHLASGGMISLGRLHRRTRAAVDELVGAVVDQFSSRPLSWQRHDRLEQRVKAAVDHSDDAERDRAEQTLRSFVAASGIRVGAVAQLQPPRPAENGGQQR